MTGKGAIHKHGSTWGKIACNLSSDVSCHAVDRSLNALARSQYLQAFPKVLVGRSDDLIASEVADD